VDQGKKNNKNCNKAKLIHFGKSKRKTQVIKDPPKKWVARRGDPGSNIKSARRRSKRHVSPGRNKLARGVPETIREGSMRVLNGAATKAETWKLTGPDEAKKGPGTKKGTHLINKPMKRAPKNPRVNEGVHSKKKEGQTKISQLNAKVDDTPLTDGVEKATQGRGPGGYKEGGRRCERGAWGTGGASQKGWGE